MMAIFSRNKKSQSEIISTILLILVAISAVSIIIAFVIPYVKNQIENSGCLDIVNQIEIKNNLKYTCYDSASKIMKIQIHIGDRRDKIAGLTLSLLSLGASNNYEINDSTMPSGVSVGSGSNLPGRNEERTYSVSNINSKPDSIKAYGKTANGMTCDSSEPYNNIPNC